MNYAVESIVVSLIEKGIVARQSDEANEILICCPFCILRGKDSPDDKYHLGLNVRKNVAHCYRCEWKCRGQAIQMLLGGSFVGATFDVVPKAEKPKTKIIWPPDFEILRNIKREYWMQKAYKLATSRGVTTNQIEKFTPGLVLIGMFRYRIVFPLYNPENRLVGFSGRTIINREPKWLHSPGLEGHLYLAQYHKRKTVVLTEGIWDALAIERCLGRVTDSVALLGHNLTEMKMDLLKRYDKVVTWLDPDSAGKQGVLHSVEMLAEFKEVEIIIANREPGDCSEVEIQQAWNNRSPWSWSTELKLKRQRIV